MSYILDALKKSEQERGRQSNAKPLPLGEVRAPANTSVSSHRPLLILLVVIAALLAVIAVLMTHGGSVGEDIAVVVRGAEPAQEVSKTSTPESLSGSVSKSVSDSVAAPVARESSESPTEQSQPEMTTGTLITPSVRTLDEAGEESVLVTTDVADRTPFEALERIPSLTITGHTYSSVPAKRQVVMDGLTWKEGDPVAKGVTLKEITRDGITLDVSGWPVVIGRSRGWQAIRDGH